LIHFAYYLKRNYFVFFYKEDNRFLPPNIEDDFCIKVSGGDYEKKLSDKFRAIGIIK